MEIIEIIKGWLKRVLPMPARSLKGELENLRKANREELEAALARIQEGQAAADRYIGQVLQELQRNQLSYSSRMEDLFQELQSLYAEQEKARESQYQNLREMLQTLKNGCQEWLQEQSEKMQTLKEEAEKDHTAGFQELSAQNTALAAELNELKRKYQELSETTAQMRIRNIDAARNSAEAVWAWIFNNTVTDSSWLKNKTFSPGRWAMGYPNLYVMYRILNETKPKKILELGLGQSTRMIGQYAAAFPDVEHLVVEHDQTWIDFFSNDFHLSSQSRILRLDRVMVPYKEADEVRVFKGFKEAMEGKKFDFIVIDAPLGADMKQYSRIDILSILPYCLEKEFAILLDDYERIGEQRTVGEIETVLKEAGIPYKKGKYSGKNDCIVIASKNQTFLTSM